MKVRDISLSSYDYRRIQIDTDHGVACFAPGQEEIFLKVHGDDDVDADAITVLESGLLVLRRTKETV